MSTQGSLQEKIVLLRDKTGAGILDCKKAITENNGDIEKAVEFLRKKGLASVAKRAGRTTKEGVVSVNIGADGKTAVISELNCETDFVAKTPEFVELSKKINQHILANPSVSNPSEDAQIKDIITQVASKVGENVALKRAEVYKLEGNGLFNYYIHTDNKKGALVEVSSAASLDSAKEKVMQIVRELALQIVAMSPRWVKSEEVPADVIEKEKEIYSTQAKNQGKSDAAIEKMLVGRIKKFYQENCLLEQASIRDSKASVKDYISQSLKDSGAEITVKRFVHYQVGE
jgi:elongation factor Ts